MNKKTSSNLNNHHFAKAGDALHVLTLASTFGFALLAGKYMGDPSSTLFDSQWKKEGFCVTNREMPFWSSHDVCMYVDTLMTMVAAGLYFVLRRGSNNAVRCVSRNDELFLRAIPTYFFHGLGHGFLGKDIRAGWADSEESRHRTLADELLEMESLLKGFGRCVLPFLIFWIFMSQACLRKSPIVYVFFASTLITLGQMWTPFYFAFTYIQSVMLLLFSIDELRSPAEEKDFAYFLIPLLVGLPVTLVSWLEATTCSSFMRDSLYGHVAYDFYIPFSMMIWYVVVQNRSAPRQMKQL